ncbi:Eco57I restriction-modification methylase domain-containing protein [Paenibacillus ehimensis]|uniref:Eco57I restriction-modification methylase domain-containing protein n=1 Tax=Paenibacillus ehimensis TaxID=79264 RepID=UPI002DB558DB|nr:Eco57I restriction-modification methylase domain-containing protein [Paenibacillus ehimensis]MEC0210987.1 Eco57I restriction-modification methylase domain-containing protein [Paenibacillus ehimensis]
MLVAAYEQSKEVRVNIKNFLMNVDTIRKETAVLLDEKKKEENEQFFSDISLANKLASHFRLGKKQYKILDPGAGVGILTAALIARICKSKTKVEKIEVVAVESDQSLFSALHKTMMLCNELCNALGIEFSFKVINNDFICLGTEFVKNKGIGTFNCIIMNPPYKKLSIRDRARKLLISANLESPNLYSGFLSIAFRMLEKKGQLVAITPRSFCNGPYFYSFRRDMMEQVSFKKIHTFESRTELFNRDKVLQENIIFHVIKDKNQKNIIISSSIGARDKRVNKYKVTLNQLIHPDDSELFIRIVKNDNDNNYVALMRRLPCTLLDLNIQVSTGKVVDFRNKEFIIKKPRGNYCPLIYPRHFVNGNIIWPLKTSKPDIILYTPETKGLLLSNDIFVLVKRFTTKEEEKRVVAAVYDPKNYPQVNKVAFENRVNYFHKNGEGLQIELAKGLSAYLNSSLVDMFFRQFNGHTQVNAADLKALKYPTCAQLINIGIQIGDNYSQECIDNTVSRVLFYR